MPYRKTPKLNGAGEMNDMDRLRFEFLKNEHLQMSEMFKTYWNGRLTVLVLFLTIIGTLTGLVFKGRYIDSFQYEVILYHEFGVFLTVAVMIRLLCTLSRGIYLFMMRMKDISAEFQVQDFWAVIPYYFNYKRRDAGTFMFYLISHVVNIVVCLVLILVHVFDPGESSLVKLFLSNLYGAITIYNMVRIEKGMNTRYFFSDSDDSMLTLWNRANQDLRKRSKKHQ